MKLTNTLIKPALVTAALALAATPAFAQHDHRRSNDGREGHAVQRSQPQRAEAPRSAPRAVAPHVESRPAPRVESHAPRVESRGVAPRVESRGRVESRVVVPRGETRVVGPNGDVRRGVAVPRSSVVVPHGSVVAPRAYGSRGYERGYSSRGYERGYAPRVYERGYYGARHYYGPGYGYRPYLFRPWRHLSFGLYLGYSVPYAYTYAYPVPVYGYGAPTAPVYVGPNSTAYGGVTLEMTPSDAQVIVDGEVVGTVADFDGTTAPLNLVAGQHHLEISAPGFAPLAFDVTVVPGQLVPYRGDLQPIR
jgi:hypothetical protein